MRREEKMCAKEKVNTSVIGRGNKLFWVSKLLDRFSVEEENNDDDKIDDIDIYIDGSLKSCDTDNCKDRKTREVCTYLCRVSVQPAGQCKNKRGVEKKRSR